MSNFSALGGSGVAIFVCKKPQFFFLQLVVAVFVKMCLV